MKRKKHSKKVRANGDKKALAGKPSATISTRHVWWFRFFAAVVIPLIVVIGFELGLRLVHFGYPTNFFLKTKIAGKEYYVPNDKFGYRFFPPALARTPVPSRMAVQKSRDTYRIFLFGESAAQGDPDPTFGAGRYLQTLLRDRFPGTDFEVICVAMTAIDSHVILPIARECARRDGDLWIIYMGNNEMVGPFGGGTVFGSRAPGVSLVRTDLAIKKTKIGQWLDSLRQKWAGHSSTPKIWSGLEMFKDHQLRYDDPNRLRAYKNFGKNLEDILKAGENTGVPIILSTVGSNLKDCAPFGSLHTNTLNDSQKNEWNDIYQNGVALESAEDYSGALKKYAQAAAIDPQFAELHFRAGHCELALTNSAAALREFELARDDDTLAFRADTRINQHIEESADAAATHGVHFLDAAKLFRDNSPGRIPGNELFYEHVHLNFTGNYLLGRAFAAQTAKLLPKSILAKDKGEWASAKVCDERLAVSPWDRFRVWQENFSRVSESPFTEQLNDVPRAKFYMAKLKELNSQMTPEAAKQSRATYEAALALSPDDYFLHGNFAQFLNQTGDLKDAIKEDKRVSELLPQSPAADYKIGALLVRQGNSKEATDYFLRALAVQKDYVPALNDLGLIRANEQKTTEAVELFKHVLRLNSGYLETYLDWGFMEQCAGNFDQAMKYYQIAANLQPEGPAAHFFRAVGLAAEHHRDDAIGYFRNAVYMNPNFWQARYLLGGELAAAGQLGEAQTQFAEAASIRPDFARAHLNDGVALAKQGKLNEALTEFTATLKLEPTNSVARQNLEAVQMNLKALKMHER